MSVEWKPEPLMAAILKMAGREKPEEECIMSAESNGAKLEVYAIETEEEGPHVRWSVTRPRKIMKAYGNISCTKEDLKSAFTRGKKLAEDIALCWPSDTAN